MKLSNYYATQDGTIYSKSTNKPLKYFKSNKYLQCCVKDDGGKKRVFGVHTLVAMLLLEDYFDGCVVHHKDGNTTNNSVDNLECLTRAEHSRHHADPTNLSKYREEFGSYNKGKRMSKESNEKRRIAALRRWEKTKSSKT